MSPVPNGAPGRLSLSDRVAQVVEQFRMALRRGESPALATFLVPGVLSGAVLAELVHAELEFRLEAGEPARVEEYLERFPELTADPAVVAELLGAEYESRRRREPGL